MICTGHNGVLIDPENPDLLSDAMAMVIDMPEAAAQMGSAARETVISVFSLDAIARAYSKLYETL